MCAYVCDALQVSGCASDYAYGEAGITLAYSVELRGPDVAGGGYGFLVPASQIVPTGMETVRALEELAAAIWEANGFSSSTSSSSGGTTGGATGAGDAYVGYRGRPGYEGYGDYPAELYMGASNMGSQVGV
eukprot:g2816.t1